MLTVKPCSQHQCVSYIQNFQKLPNIQKFKPSQYSELQNLAVLSSSEAPNVKKFRTSQY